MRLQLGFFPAGVQNLGTLWINPPYREGGQAERERGKGLLMSEGHAAELSLLHLSNEFYYILSIFMLFPIFEQESLKQRSNKAGLLPLIPAFLTHPPGLPSAHTQTRNSAEERRLTYPPADFQFTGSCLTVLLQ